jgi:transcriptional regulator with XRE-family HTH domain
MGKKQQISRETKKWEKEEQAYLKVLGENIIRIKKEKKLTSKQIYDELDIDKSNYRRIEAGKTNVSILLLTRIAKTLSVKVSELIKNFE